MKKMIQPAGIAKALSAAEGMAEVLKAPRAVAKEAVILSQAVGRTLAEAVHADRPLPPYDRSAMDGYAVRSKECQALPVQLNAVGIAPAGQPYSGAVPANACVRIMTGAVVPKGLDAVVPMEQIKSQGTSVTIAADHVQPWQHIHRRGSDAKNAQILLPAGHRLRPVDIATLASVGVGTPRVHRKVRVHMLATGTELVAVTAKPAAHQIRESNIATLEAVLAAMPGISGMACGMGGDQASPLKKTIQSALRTCDVLLTTGGVSAGDYDLVPEILGSLGVRCVFHKLRIKPGKPLWFGVSKKGQLVFGLPGNPVSTLTTFHEFVLPALRMLMGQPVSAAGPERLYLPLSESFTKKSPLLEFARAQLLPGQAGEYARVAPADHGGSGDFYSLTRSDGVMVLPENEHDFEAGQVVEFHPWRFV